MRSVIIFAAAGLAAGIIIPHYADQLSRGRMVSEATAPRPPATETAAANGGRVVVEPDSTGRFRIEGDVDGRSVNFIIDTGASTVTLTQRYAASLGIYPSKNDYTVPLTTANGTVRAAPTRLDRVEVGNLALSDVQATVMPDGTLHDNLLGMSFLLRLRHFEYHGDRMVLEQ